MARCRCFTFLIALGLSLPMLSVHADQRYVLTSTEQNVHRDSWKLSGGNWSVEKKTLHGGKQEGVDLITIDNGVLQIDVIPTRGMSVYEVRSGDMRLGWDSPVEDIVHPALIDLESRGGLGWLEGFNEWMVRCGLEFAGHPGTDEFEDGAGGTTTRDLTLHGKIGNIPASEVEVIIDSAAPHRIRVRGIVYEKFFYGPKLKLVTEVSVVPGQDSFRIDDTVENLGAQEQEFQIIYHANFGAPLLGPGATVHAAVKSLAPMDAHAAESIDGYATYLPPTAGFVEQVYLVEPLTDEHNRTGAVLQNAAADRAASMHWSAEQLPYLTIWKNTAATEDGYVTGIEPATGYPYNRKVERAAGRVPKLSPGQKRQFTLDIGLHRGKDNVKAVVEQIQSLQGDHPVDVQREPPKS
ncbi:aldose 1-epimerase family protein [Stieleria sp. ICT_E10.1]|uniref:aldose 1-epimerase family protein n=1 Tax=Stieleria sedimenti TaxID=2976331 RepID=UPI00218097DB|nr:aldose 1-epimerase family protein [Stieleria sedimenti]MCS7467123.1 aldose 1-epimerase family protein [Stieleria sedimenti]